MAKKKPSLAAYPWHRLLRDVTQAMFTTSPISRDERRTFVNALVDVGWGLRTAGEIILLVLLRLLFVLIFPISIPISYYVTRYNIRHEAEAEAKRWQTASEVWYKSEPGERR